MLRSRYMNVSCYTLVSSLMLFICDNLYDYWWV